MLVVREKVCNPDQKKTGLQRWQNFSHTGELNNYSFSGDTNSAYQGSALFLREEQLEDYFRTSYKNDQIFSYVCLK